MAVAVPPPTAGPAGTLARPWLPVLALAVGALVLGVFWAGRSQPADVTPPLSTAVATAANGSVPASGDPRGVDAEPNPRHDTKPVAAPTEPVEEPRGRSRLAATAAPTVARPTDPVAIPSVHANPTEERDDDEDEGAGALPSPSPSEQVDPENPPTAVATSTPGPTNRPRPTATPVSPTPGLPEL